MNKALSTDTPSQQLSKFFEERWQYSMLDKPEFATVVGHPGQNDRWMDLSQEAFDRRQREDVCQLDLLRKIPIQGLEDIDRVNFQLMEHLLEISIDAQKFGGRYLALNHLYGLHMTVPDILNKMPGATRQDYEDMLARLEKVPVVEMQTEALLRAGLARKITPVKALLTRVPAQFDKVLPEKIEDSPIYRPFVDIKANLTDSEKADIRRRAKQAISHAVYPALRKLKDFLISAYIPGARDGISLKDMPNGTAWYAFCIKEYTTADMTADQLHELGIKEVTRITREMEKARDAAKFNGDLKAFNKFLLTDQRFFYTDKEQLLSGYRDIAKRIDAELPRLFGRLPRLTYGVREMSAYKASEAPAAYYEVGSPEAGRPGYFAANTTDLPGRPKWAMEVLTLHEAVPGHHLQISIAQELRDRPQVLRYSSNEAFSEGWGLYAESLGDEAGLYKDAYSKYGQLAYEIWRAVRLVVDTGIHAKGWSRDQALTYFADHVPKSNQEVENEIDRYITWPGQALSYKVGQLKFLELRRRATSTLGEKFDIRRFHDQLLKHGDLPMTVLERLMDEWVDLEMERTT